VVDPTASAAISLNSDTSGVTASTQAGNLALALLDPDQHERAVDIVDLETGHLRHAQARAIGGAENGRVLDSRSCIEQAADFLDTQYIRQLARRARQDQASRKALSPVEVV
jgi:hypothetical protein